MTSSGLLSTETSWTRHDLVFVGASSLHGAIRSLPNYWVGNLNHCFFTRPGLSWKRHPVHQSVQEILRGSAQGHKVVIWDDSIGNSLSFHPRKKTPALTADELLEEIRPFKDRIAAILYIQREGTENVFERLRELDTLILHSLKNLSSKRQQRTEGFEERLSVVHPEHQLELHKVELIIRNHQNLRNLIQQKRSKQNKDSAAKRRKKQDKAATSIVNNNNLPC